MPNSGQKAGSAETAARAAAESGVISGTVIGPDGVPLAGICVTATGTRGRQLARTNGDGSYTLTGIPAGAYTVDYTDCASPDSYAATTYPGGSVDVASARRASLEPVALTASSPAQAIATEQAYAHAHQSAATATKAVKYAVTGRVRNKSGKPLAGICVTGTAKAELKLGTKARPKYLKLDLLAVAKTNRQGFYEVRTPELPTNYHVLSWQVLFTMGCGNGGNYAPQWWHNAASSGKASTLPATAHKITGIDAVMTEGASIAGVIRGRSASGPGLAGACVQASGLGGQRGVSITAHTRAGGRYVLHGLGTGSYDVFFSPCKAGNYLPGKHGKVSVRVRTTKVVSGFLVAGATVTGTVTSSEAGHPKLGKICVYLSSSKGGIWLADTAKSGRYSIDRLRSGTYYVGFTGCGTSGSYAPQFYRKGASTGTLSSAAASGFKLTTGGTYTANVAMLPGGTIEGTVTGQPSGGPLRGVCMEADSQTGLGGLFILGGPIVLESLSFATTNSAGHYRLANLRPGLYAADFSDCAARSAYSSAWFAPEGGQSPQWVSVAGGATVGVNVALPLSGTITGTIRSPAGRGLKGVCVEAVQQGVASPAFFSPYGGGAASLVLSAKTGKYRIGGLPPGEYSVGFDPSCNTSKPAYAAQWYKGKAPGSFTAVEVRAGRTTPDINARLTVGKTVHGVVISGITGKPVRACLIVTPGTQNEVSEYYLQTSKAGTFTLKHVAAGTYQVDGDACGAGAAHLAELLTVIKIPAGGSTAIRLRLPRAGEVAGTVTAPGVTGGAAFACVEVTSDSAPNYEQIAIAGRNGRFSATNLAPGGYLVQINDACAGGTTLAPQVISVNVAAGATTKVTAALAATGSITGTVTSSASSSPVAGICVGAFAGTSATQPSAVAVTGANGSYQIGFLPSGSYLVKFSSGCGATGYATQWYNDASSATTATPVAVSSGAARSGVDASLSS